MIDSATDTAFVAASPEHCLAVAIDFARYPEWAPDVKDVRILDTDSAGRATKVEFRASALGRSTHTERRV